MERSGETGPSREDETHTLRRLGDLLRPYYARLIGVLVMLFALTGANIARPILVGLFVDHVLNAQKLAILWLILAGFLLIYLVRNILYFYSKYSTVQVGENVAFTLRKRLFERLQQMNLQFYKKHNAGQISSRVMNDSFVVQSFIQDNMPTLLQSSLMTLGLVAALFTINPTLGLAATIVLPCHLIAAKYFRRPIKRSSKQAQQQLGVVQGNLIEKFLGVEVVKGFTGEQRETEAFQSAIESSRRWQLRSHKFHVFQKVVADLLIGIGTVALIGFGALQVVQGPMSTGDFMAFFGLVMMLYPEVLELMSGFAKLTKASSSIDRVFEVLEADASESAERAQPITQPIRGEIEFDSVSFQYEPGTPVLRDVSLKVPAGKVCAIIGPSGTGKSTLVNLVPRFRDPDYGYVRVDGVDVRDYDLRHLRSAIGIAFQDCFLFNSTIMENLRYARPDATREQIIEMAQRTGAHDFISKLPDGYDTRVGEEGISVSRGEAQRITLTRAMLKDPQILILDEATASIDTAGQAKIIPAVLDFMHGKTTLMITHNPELITHADMVVQIVEGRVVFQGPPEQLDSEVLRPRPGGESLRRRPPSDSGIWDAARLALIAGLLTLGSAAGARAYAQANGQAAAPAAAARGEAEPADAPAETPAPADATGRFIPLPGLNTVEIRELIDVARITARAELGYEQVGDALAETLPDAPPEIKNPVTLARAEGEGLRALQMGYQLFRSQPPRIYLVGYTLLDDRTQGNPDVEALAQMIGDGREALEKQYETISPQDLTTGAITLSYVEADRCLGMLKGLGYQTIEYKGGNGLGKNQIIEPTAEVDVKDLPAVMLVPGSDAIDLVGGDEARGGAFGLVMTPSIANELPHNTAASRTMDLMVLYHPAHPEQFSEVLDRVRNSIDLPARQILIEAMVLEISETGLDKLGVEWELSTPFGSDPLDNVSDVMLGRLPDFPGGQQPTADVEISDVFGHFKVQLQALVREGRARILSRPSVLTLDNRQASLRVGEEIPVATSATGLRGGDKISFDFKYIPVGILLNVRPRIAADGEEVSMQVDGIVSATVPGEELIVRDQNGNELARAPRISARRVQTYSRIANNTPFIIGGLVSRDDTMTEDKVPLLGDLPAIGGLFRSRETDKLRREVIIVITPYVLPDNRTVGRNMPKDEDAFDSFGNDLFRDAYRIRADDVFDLAFITDNPQLKAYKQLATDLVRNNFKLADRYPFNRFIGDRVPGERILVRSEVYEVIKRLDLSDQVDARRIIFFEPEEASPSGFDVSFLAAYLDGLADAPPAEKKGGLFGGEAEDDLASLFRGLDGQALAMTYTMQYGNGVSRILDQPVPEVRLVDCPDRDAWAQLLWELNQPDDQGRPRHTILLYDEEDLVRIKRAVLLKRVVQLNANRNALTLNNFSIGRLLLMPTVRKGKVYLLDEEAAKYFFYTEQYYPALQKELMRDVEALKNAMKLPEVSQYLDRIELPQDEPFMPRLDIQMPQAP